MFWWGHSVNHTDRCSPAKCLELQRATDGAHEAIRHLLALRRSRHIGGPSKLYGLDD